MNYRHAFHAGNFADVHKHVLLLALLERLKRKPAPLFFMDTHAGRGRYNLESSDAQRGNESQTGVLRLLGKQVIAPDIASYMRAAGISADNSAKTLRHYPGSPLIAINALRDGDRSVFVEQQPLEAKALEQALTRRKSASVVCGDGYAALKTYLPPRENRGLILIDPPYESEREFANVQRALGFGLARWPNGMFALWYPIKAAREPQRFLAALQKSRLRKLLLLELTVRAADSPIGLNGSGMLIANPPWQFDVEMVDVIQELHRILAPEQEGGTRVEWLVGE